jgi:hypothetical protein
VLFVEAWRDEHAGLLPEPVLAARSRAESETNWRRTLRRSEDTGHDTTVLVAGDGPLEGLRPPAARFADPRATGMSIALSTLADLAQPPAAEGAVEQRQRRRHRVLLAGKLAFGRFCADCTIRDLTASGAQVHAPAVLGLPDIVFLLILKEGIVVRAERIWARAQKFGLAFLDAQAIETADYPAAPVLQAAWRASVLFQAG